MAASRLGSDGRGVDGACIHADSLLQIDEKFFQARMGGGVSFWLPVDEYAWVFLVARKS